MCSHAKPDRAVSLVRVPSNGTMKRKRGQKGHPHPPPTLGFKDVVFRLVTCAIAVVLFLDAKAMQHVSVEMTVQHRGLRGEDPLTLPRLPETASGAGAEAGEDTKITLPSNLAAALGELKPSEVAPRCADPRIVIKVYAYKRTASLDRLMSSLDKSDYMGDRVTLEFHVDGGASPEVVSYVRDYKWKHGKAKIHFRKERVGLMANIAESWDPSDDCEFAVMLEDDTEVSPLFYYYAKSLLTHPEYQNRPDMVGFSLYTPKWNEIKYPNVHFSIPTNDPLFLFQLPCSWGALYFPQHWRDFRGFMRERVRFENTGKGINSNVIPEESRTNTWKNSWKRYFIEYMFFRGLFMMYPNFDSHRSLSTTHRERGEHTRKDGKPDDAGDVLSKPSRFALDHYIQDLVRTKEDMGKDLDFGSLPPIDSMTVVNLFHRKSSRQEIKLAGIESSVVKRRNSFYMDIVHGKNFCALDVDFKRGESKSTTQKYFLYEPQNGLSNQIQAIHVAVLAAKQLGRTLVVPPVIAEDSTLLDPADVFDLSSLPGDWVHYKDYHASQATRVVERNQRRFSEGSDEFFFRTLGLDRGSKEGKATRVNFMDIFGKEKMKDYELKALFGGCADETLAFSNIYLLLPVEKSLSQIPAWSTKVRNAAKQRIQSLEKHNGVAESSKYSCLHLRRGDFEQYCGHINRRKKSQDPGPYGSPRFDTFSFETCFIDPLEASRVVKPRLQSGEVLYVATNEKDRTLLEESFKGLDWRQSSDFADEVDVRLLHAVDQAFCENARVFYKNDWSTFSKLIASRREARSDAKLPSFSLGFGEMSFGLVPGDNTRKE